MSQATNDVKAAIAPEEVQRRIAEMRRAFWERRLPPVVVYQPEQRACPWPDCGYSIAGIHFKLDQWADPAVYSSWLYEWWQGAGLVARCPGCHRFVRFGVLGKEVVADQCGVPSPVLPDEWYGLAHFVPRCVAVSFGERELKAVAP